MDLVNKNVDYIELRVCGDQSTFDEDVPVEKFAICHIDIKCIQTHIHTHTHM